MFERDYKVRKTKYLSYIGAAFVPHGDDFDVVIGVTGSIKATQDTSHFSLPLIVPNGATITRVIVYGFDGGAGVGTFSTRKYDYDGATVEVEANKNINESSNVSWQVGEVDTLNKNGYFVYAKLDTNQYISGCLVEYTIYE